MTAMLIALLGISISTFSQNTFFNGELVAPKEYGAYIYQTKDTAGSDGQYCAAELSMFRVVDKWRDSQFIYVKEVGGDKSGYMLAEEVDKHPVPEFMFLHRYEDDANVMNQIGLNFAWHQYYNKTGYSAMKGDHAGYYYLMACNYLKSDSLQKAVVYFTKSITTMPKRSAYLGRALAKSMLLDYVGAIMDCNKAIYMDANPVSQPNGGDYFRSMDVFIDLSVQPNGMRGFCYMKQGNLTSAISDFNIAVKKAPKNPDWYIYRGVCKYDIGQKTSACLDWSSAGELGDSRAYEYIRDYCK